MARRTSRRSRRRRTSRRRVSSNKRRRAARSYFLHYRTPGGSKKTKRLGRTKDASGEALKKWQRRVRGKGYRILKVFSCAGGIVGARKLMKAAA